MVNIMGIAVSKRLNFRFRKQRERSPSSSSRLNRRPNGFIGSLTTFPRKEILFRKGGSSKYLYQVKFGCILAYSTFNTGRRRIWAFYLPGDYIGLEMGEIHARSAQAATPSTVYKIRKEKLKSLAARNVAVVKRLLDITEVELQRAQNHITLLQQKSPLVRIAEFLIEIKKRMKSRNTFDLPMSNLDIADYLNLRHETVSRVLAKLEKMSAISFKSQHRVVIHRGNRFWTKVQK